MWMLVVVCEGEWEERDECDYDDDDGGDRGGISMTECRRDGISSSWWLSDLMVAVGCCGRSINDSFNSINHDCRSIIRQ